MFEFDAYKSAQNKEKHGIDFLEAQELWQDQSRVVFPSSNTEEPRYVMISRLHGNCWSAIFTYRQNKIRIISVRRSRENEKAIYFGSSI